MSDIFRLDGIIESEVKIGACTHHKLHHFQTAEN